MVKRKKEGEKNKMSFKAKYKTKIKEVNYDFLKEAVELMTRDLEIKEIKREMFRIYDDKNVMVKGICFKDRRASYPVDMRINEKNELEIVCDTVDREVYREYTSRVEKQFYPAVVISHKTGSPVKYDKETEKLVLMITR